MTDHSSTENNPDLVVEVQIKNGHVQKATSPDNWRLPTNVLVHVFDYYKGCPKELLEADDQKKGEECRQTIYTGPSGHKNEEKKKIRVYIREGKVIRVIMPAGTVVIVKNYAKENGDPDVQRWVCKKK